MPKRAPTPPPADDSRFFTVLNPYPVQPNADREDCKRFARWIACATGADYFLAFYYKPMSPNAVVIEVSTEAPDFGDLLGEHRWGEILKKPTSRDVSLSSRIFYCTRTSARALEKIGWRRYDVLSSWYKNWAPQTDPEIIYPYPPPHHCELPAEDITRYPLCRALPGPRSPLIAAKPVTVVGSTDYVNFKIARTHPTRSQRQSVDWSVDSDWEDFPSFASVTGEDVRRPRALITRRSATAISVPKSGAVVEAHAPSHDALWPEQEDEGDADTERDTDVCPEHGARCHGAGICKAWAERQKAQRRTTTTAQQPGNGRQRGEKQANNEHARTQTQTRPNADRLSAGARGLASTPAAARAKPAAAPSMPTHLRKTAAAASPSGSMGESTASVPAPASASAKGMPAHLMPKAKGAAASAGSSVGAEPAWSKSGAAGATSDAVCLLKSAWKMPPREAPSWAAVVRQGEVLPVEEQVF